MRTYLVTFPTVDGTGAVDQPAHSATDAVRMVDKGYRHIACCVDAACTCHNPKTVVIDGYAVDAPTSRHAGPVYYQTSTPHGMVTHRATGNGKHRSVWEI